MKKKSNKKMIIIGSILIFMIFMIFVIIFFSNNQNEKNKIVRDYNYNETITLNLQQQHDEEKLTYANQYYVEIVDNMDESDTYDSKKITYSNESVHEYQYDNNMATVETIIDSDDVYDSFEDIDWNDVPRNTTVYYYETKQDGSKTLLRARKTPDMNKTIMSSIKDAINSQDDFYVGKVISIFTDDVFSKLYSSELKFNTATKTVLDDSNMDVTKKMLFDTSRCETAFDFLSAYLQFDGAPYEFSLEDVPDLTYPRDTYHFNNEICDMSNELSTIACLNEVTNITSVYSLNQHEIDEDAMLEYVTITVTGTNDDGKNVRIIATYQISHP